MTNGFMMGALALALAGGAMAQPANSQAPAPTPAPTPRVRALKTAEEQKALQTLMQADSPDAQIAAAEAFVVHHPHSDFKPLALLGEAQAYQKKGDYDHEIVFGELALDSDPDDGTKVQALIFLANAIAAKTGEFDFDREEKLAKVEKYATAALDLLKTMPKPNPALPDQAWAADKADMIGDAHVALGIDQMSRKDYGKAIEEFRTAVETAKDPDAAAYVRLAAAYDKAGKYDEALAVCDKTLALPGLAPVVASAARSERETALKMKGAAAKP